MPLALIQLEFHDRSLWWIAISAAIGVSLLAFGWMIRRPAQPPGAPASRDPRAASLPSQAAPRFFHPPLPPLAMGMGGVILLITLLLGWWNRGQFSRNFSTPAAPNEANANFRETLLAAWLVFALAAAVIVFYRGANAALTPWRRRSLVSLRLTGLLAMLLLLFRPVLAIVQGQDSDKPSLALVVDASASMGYNDAANEPNRFRQAAIAINNTLIPALADTYRIRLFAYDGKHTAALAGPSELDAIVPDGMVTDLGAAIALATTSPDAAGHSQNLAAAVLFSDGIHNGPVTVDAEIARLGTALPVHTVRVGSSELEPSAVPDIAVVSVDGPQTAVVNNQVVLTASIKSTAMSDRTVRVTLWQKPDGTNAAGPPLDEQRLVLHSSAVPQTVQLKFTPEKVGRAVVRVQVPIDPGERSDTNNQQDFALLVTDPKLTVLYVEGKVRPEVGPLRRALEQDPNLAAMSLVQTTAGRFEMSGAKIGAGAGAEEIKGLPTTLAQWKRFKVIVLGDLDASFLNPQQQKDLEQAVRDGAGLVMIGGQNSFASGGWDKTTLAALLPVTLEKTTPPQINAPFVPKLTATGAPHPIFRNIASYFIGPDNKKGPITVPDLLGCVALAGAKAGADVLAVHPTAQVNNAPAIVLAVQQYGKGRTAAFAADTTHNWIIPMRALGQESPYYRFWGQLIRWLASEENLEKKTGASVTAMLAREHFESGETVPLRAAVTDSQGQATNFAKAWADITGPDGKTTRLDLLAHADDSGIPGIYDGAFKPAMAGTHKVLFGASKDNADLGKDSSTFTVLPAAGERDVLAAQPHTLETISRLTDGTSIDLSALNSLADRLLASAPHPPVAAHTIPLFHDRGFFLAFVALFATEWFLRRRWQLL